MLGECRRSRDNETSRIGAREFTRAGEGLPYGLSLSPDGRRVAFHLAGPEGYQVFTSNTDRSDRVRVAGTPGHPSFRTSWAPARPSSPPVPRLPSPGPGHRPALACARSRGHGERLAPDDP